MHFCLVHFHHTDVNLFVNNMSHNQIWHAELHHRIITGFPRPWSPGFEQNILIA